VGCFFFLNFLVSGGYSPSMLDALRHSLTASKVISSRSKEQAAQAKLNAATTTTTSKTTNPNGAPPLPQVFKSLSYMEAFYLATLGGAEVMGLQDRVGNFLVGKEFDALLIDLVVDGREGRNGVVGKSVEFQQEDTKVNGGGCVGGDGVVDHENGTEKRKKRKTGTEGEAVTVNGKSSSVVVGSDGAGEDEDDDERDMALIDLFPHDTVETSFEKFLYLGDDRNISQVFVKGVRVM
jgi:hypothetical protein